MDKEPSTRAHDKASQEHDDDEADDDAGEQEAASETDDDDDDDDDDLLDKDDVDMDLDDSSSSLSSSSTDEDALLHEGSSEEESEDEELPQSWIAMFCSRPGNEFFCRVNEDFVGDSFNLTGLSSAVPYYTQALELVTDLMPDMEQLENEIPSAVKTSAELLYGLIHQRYVLTKQGLAQMGLKYEAGVFGTCPRALCSDSKLSPVGLSDTVGHDQVKLFCPKCRELYLPDEESMHLDGAFFGTTMAHLLFSSYPHLLGPINLDTIRKYQPPLQFLVHRVSTAPSEAESASVASAHSSGSTVSSPEPSAAQSGPTTAGSLAIAHTRMLTMTKWQPRWENSSSDDEDEDAPSTMPLPIGQVHLTRQTLSTVAPWHSPAKRPPPSHKRSKALRNTRDGNGQTDSSDQLSPIGAPSDHAGAATAKTANGNGAQQVFFSPLKRKTPAGGFA